jgi:hypothetical protein
MPIWGEERIKKLPAERGVEVEDYWIACSFMSWSRYCKSLFTRLASSLRPREYNLSMSAMPDLSLLCPC